MRCLPTSERTSHSQGRCPRRPVKGGGFHDPKRLQPTSELRKARERRPNLAIGASFLAPRHSKAQEGSRARSCARVQPQPNTFATIGAPPAGICKQPKARAQPANIRTSHVLTPFQRETRCSSRSREPREHPAKTRLTPRRCLLCGPASIQPACAVRRLGQLKRAEHTRVTARVRADVGDAPTLADQPRLDSNRLARTIRLSTNPCVPRLTSLHAVVPRGS
jgi:hypothetical protein